MGVGSGTGEGVGSAVGTGVGACVSGAGSAVATIAVGVASTGADTAASDEAFLDGDFFGDIFGAAWTAFPDAGSCKIGYALRYTLDDGTEIRYTMLSPAHIEHTEFIECWLYDDYHQKPHKFYSHLKPSKMKSDTLITSIKLTAGSQIKRVTDIWLTAFICASLDDFDADRNYIGSTSCTIHILKE